MLLRSKIEQADGYVQDFEQAIGLLPQSNKERRLRILQGVDLQCRTFSQELNHIEDPDRTELIQQMTAAADKLDLVEDADPEVSNALAGARTFMRLSIKHAVESPFH